MIARRKGLGEAVCVPYMGCYDTTVFGGGGCSYGDFTAEQCAELAKGDAAAQSRGAYQAGTVTGTPPLSLTQWLNKNALMVAIGAAGFFVLWGFSRR